MVVLKDFYDMPENNAVICKIARRQLEVAASIRVSPSTTGERCVLRSRASGGWKGRSLIAAIASDGTKHHLLKEGSINKEAFGEFVLEALSPRDGRVDGQLLDTQGVTRGV
jgi:hypothetical protein